MTSDDTSLGHALRVEDALGACRAVHGRLNELAQRVDDEGARRASRLPNWSVGHVFTHLARNAEGHSRWLGGALEGRFVERYPGGSAQREADIEAGAGRRAAGLRDDVAATSAALEEVWDRLAAAGWPDPPLVADASTRWPSSEGPWRRLLEVEVHLVDLDLGFEPRDWSDTFVAWMLPRRLHHLERRLSSAPGDARSVLAWLTGRRDEPGISSLEL